MTFPIGGIGFAIATDRNCHRLNNAPIAYRLNGRPDFQANNRTVRVLLPLLRDIGAAPRSSCRGISGDAGIPHPVENECRHPDRGENVPRIDFAVHSQYGHGGRRARAQSLAAREDAQRRALPATNRRKVMSAITSPLEGERTMPGPRSLKSAIVPPLRGHHRPVGRTQSIW